jgi:hypothetical protein
VNQDERLRALEDERRRMRGEERRGRTREGAALAIAIDLVAAHARAKDIERRMRQYGEGPARLLAEERDIREEIGRLEAALREAEALKPVPDVSRISPEIVYGIAMRHSAQIKGEAAPAAAAVMSFDAWMDRRQPGWRSWPEDVIAEARRDHAAAVDLARSVVEAHLARREVR